MSERVGGCKLVSSLPAGPQLFEPLRGAAPALVDPGTTALWEMKLDDVVTGKTDFRVVIDGVAAAALGLIDALLIDRTERSIWRILRRCVDRDVGARLDTQATEPNSTTRNRFAHVDERKRLIG